ncbi:MAG: exodeoxyribonuclease 7 large subunit/superoxide dismutase [Pseudomonadota bacterium]|jgi:exodeoxyribonuclease VII large subunit
MTARVTGDGPTVSAAPAARAWGVGALMLAVGDALGARFGVVSVRGELSGFTRAASGHCYFTLKDADGQSATLRCAMFRRAAGMLAFRPADGQQVELRGRLAVYEARGELQCIVEHLQPLGAGSLYEMFLRLRAKLEAAGLFDAGRKRPLPVWPRTLGIVTSLGAAALHDVLTAIRRRAPHVRVVVYPSVVQGADAPAQLVRAIVAAVDHGVADALIVCRGGGSLEDLWAFNDELLVRTIAACPLPVVCGVGHETDVTLAELAADVRAPTPTAAAELATPRRDEALLRLSQLAGRLQRALHHRLDGQAQRLDRLALQIGRPTRLLRQQQARLQALQLRLPQAARAVSQTQQSRLEAVARRGQASWQRQWPARGQALAQLQLRLQALDPQRVLARGYAWLADGQGRPVTSARGLEIGQTLQARWHDGQAEVQVRRLPAATPTSTSTSTPLRPEGDADD